MSRLQGHGGNAGPSIIETVWEELDRAYAELKIDITCYKGGVGQQVDIGKGKCLGLATALAIFMNPYLPDIDAIREEAQERWDANQE